MTQSVREGIAADPGAGEARDGTRLAAAAAVPGPGHHRASQSLLAPWDVSKFTTCSSVKLLLLLDCWPMTAIW